MKACVNSSQQSNPIVFPSSWTCLPIVVQQLYNYPLPTPTRRHTLPVADNHRNILTHTSEDQRCKTQVSQGEASWRLGWPVCSLLVSGGAWQSWIPLVPLLYPCSLCCCLHITFPLCHSLHFPLFLIRTLVVGFMTQPSPRT